MIRFYVFSYNRGAYLANCVRSIESCAPACPVFIVDDDSDDPATRDVLAELAGRHRILTPDSTANRGKHGGLYANMQMALDAMTDDTFCFLQDDMQLVRPLAPAETEAIAAYLRDCSPPRLLQPAFLKGCNRHSDGPLTRYDPSAGGYFVDRFANSAGAHYADVMIANAGRLRAVNWRFGQRESHNETRARETLGQMLYLKNPFVAWLPGVPAYRGKARTLALRMAQRHERHGLYPFDIMTAAENASFCQRDGAVLPWAEDFLRLREDGPPRPWRYHPLQGRRLLKLLNSIELRLRP